MKTETGIALAFGTYEILVSTNEGPREMGCFVEW